MTVPLFRHDAAAVLSYRRRFVLPAKAGIQSIMIHVPGNNYWIPEAWIVPDNPYALSSVHGGHKSGMTRLLFCRYRQRFVLPAKAGIQSIMIRLRGNRFTGYRNGMTRRLFNLCGGGELSAPRERRLLVVGYARVAAADTDLTELVENRGGWRRNPTVAHRHAQHWMLATRHLFQHRRVLAQKFANRYAVDRIDLRLVGDKVTPRTDPNYNGCHDEPRPRAEIVKPSEYGACVEIEANLFVHFP